MFKGYKMNAVIINGETRISQVLTRKEAEERLESIKMIYPNARVESVNEEIKSKVKINVIPEEVEDLSCAGGACTL